MYVRVQCVWGTVIILGLSYSPSTHIVIYSQYYSVLSVYTGCTRSVGIIVYISVHWNWIVTLSLFILLVKQVFQFVGAPERVLRYV